MATNKGVWAGWNYFYGSGNYSISGDVLSISTTAANQSSMLYLSRIVKPGERITVEFDARALSGIGRITASSRVAYTAYNTAKISGHTDFRTYSFEFEAPTKQEGPALAYIGIGLWRADNTTSTASMEFVMRSIRSTDTAGRDLMRPDTFGLLQPETRMLLSCLMDEPYKARTSLIDDVIYKLKAAGIWAKLDALYVLAEPYESLALVNWINPGQYDLKAVNSPTFSADVGYTGRVDAVTAPYLQTSFNPVALAGTDDDGNGIADEPWAAKFTQNNNSMFVWASYVEGTPAYIIGTRAHAINPFSESYADRVYCRNGVESGSYVSGVARASGLYGMSRDNTINYQVYANGVSAGTITSAPSVMYSESIQILKRAANSDTANGNPIRIAGFGSALTAQEWASLYAIFASYLSSIDYPSATLDASYAWASKPNAVLYPGAEITISDVGIGGSRWRSNGTRWVNMHPVVLGQLGNPVTRLASISTAESSAVYTLTVPGGVMGANSLVQMLPLATCNNSATSKTLRVKAAGGSIGTFILTTVVAEQPIIMFRNINSLSAQKTFTGNSSAIGSINTAPAATNVNTAVDWSLTATLQAESVLNNDSITLESVTVVLF